MSRDGAAATLITSAGLSPSRSVVVIAADGVVLGKASKGFTLTGGGIGEYAVRTAIFGAANVTVTGNMAIGNFGFGFVDDNTTGFGNEFNNNWAIGNGETAFESNGATGLRGNVAIKNAIGLDVGSNIAGADFVRSNMAVGNVTGFLVRGEPDFFGNAALGNRDPGVEISTGSPLLEKSSVFGNDPPGVAPSTNCGVRQTGSGAAQTSGFYFGAATSGADPADDECDDGSGTLGAVSFSTKEIKVSVKAMK
jgi:hypothetical protein